MYEKILGNISPQPFAADGTSDGVITIANTIPFKVKQTVRIQAIGQLDLLAEIVDITDINTIRVNTNVSLYTLVDNATIGADQQARPTVGALDLLKLVYSEQPTVALRTSLVDPLGNPYLGSNPLPVTFSSTPEVTNRITAYDNDPNAGDIHSSVRINNGTYDLKVNSDGSINVVTGATAGTAINEFAQISSVVANSQTQILSYTVPVGKTLLLLEVEVGGTNIAQYEVYINGVLQARRRTYFGSALADTFDFAVGNSALSVAASGIISVQVLHLRPVTGDFEARLLGLLE